MFEIRSRIMDVDPGSFLGIAEGFPDLMVHADSANEVEAALMTALEDYLMRLQDKEATRLQLDDLPTVRVVRISLRWPVAWKGLETEVFNWA